MSDRFDVVTEILLKALVPFCEETLKNKWPKDWDQKLDLKSSSDLSDWDLYGLLKLIKKYWSDAFVFQIKNLNTRSNARSAALASVERLLELRNAYAHLTLKRGFTDREFTRFLDNADIFVRAIGREDVAVQLTGHYRAHLKAVVDSAVMSEVAKETTVEANPSYSEQVKLEFKNAEAIRFHPVFYEFLEREASRKNLPFKIKNNSMMSVDLNGIQMPVPVLILAKANSTKFKIELDDLHQEFSKLNAVTESEYIRKRAVLSKSLIEMPDSLTFSMSDISMDGETCRIAGARTSYLSTIASHDVLEHELLMAAYVLSQSGQLTVENLARLLPRRARFFSLQPTEQRRYCGMAIATLVVYKSQKDKYKVMFRKRSEKTAVHSGLLHVIPAGMFQAEIDPEKEWSVEFSVIKEWCEELFGESLDVGRLDPYYIFDEFQSAKDIRKALNEGQCELFHSGVVLGLPNLRPEICCVLMIHDESWFESQQKRFRPNWEYVLPSEMLQTHGAKISDYDLEAVVEEFSSSEGGKLGVPGHVMSSKWLPTGLAAFWLGVDTAIMRLRR